MQQYYHYYQETSRSRFPPRKINNYIPLNMIFLLTAVLGFLLLANFLSQKIRNWRNFCQVTYFYMKSALRLSTFIKEIRAYFSRDSLSNYVVLFVYLFRTLATYYITFASSFLRALPTWKHESSKILHNSIKFLCIRRSPFTLKEF